MLNLLCALHLHQFGGNLHQEIHGEEVIVTENCVNCAKQHIASHWRVQYESGPKIRRSRPVVHRPSRTPSLYVAR